MSCKVSAAATTATDETFTPSEGLTSWGLHHPFQEEAERGTCSCPWTEPRGAL